MIWNVLVTASPLADAVGETARGLLGSGSFALNHPARYGPLSDAAARALVDAREGRRPRWVVNPAVFESPALRIRS